MAWTQRYASTHKYDETVAFAEERSFLEDYKNPLIQLDAMKVMLVISHTDNTFDKTQLRKDKNPLIKRTNLKIDHFIKDNEIKQFFSML